jgi:hypothetical protein
MAVGRLARDSLATHRVRSTTRKPGTGVMEGRARRLVNGTTMPRAGVARVHEPADQTVETRLARVEAIVEQMLTQVSALVDEVAAALESQRSSR